jgi:chromatin remodeling complex protein RSC6
MVRASKSDKSSTPAPTNVETVKPEVTEKKARKPKTVEAAVPVVQSVAATESAPVNEVVEVAESSVSAKMNEFAAKMQQAFSIFSTLKSDFKTLDKAISRQLKAAEKSSSKKSKRSGNRAPSGFVKPTRISDELAAFLGKSSGAEMARTEVSKEINAYIRANNLQDKDNGRKILPDSKLTTLLKIQNNEELTYFNLQRFMKHHFIKQVAVATA